MLSVFPLVMNGMEQEKNTLERGNKRARALYEKVNAESSREEQLKIIKEDRKKIGCLEEYVNQSSDSESSDAENEIEKALREFELELVLATPYLLSTEPEKKDSDEKLNNFMQQILAAPDGKTRMEMANNTNLYNEILAEAPSEEEQEVLKLLFEGLKKDDDEALATVRMILGK